VKLVGPSAERNHDTEGLYLPSERFVRIQGMAVRLQGKGSEFVRNDKSRVKKFYAASWGATSLYTR